jgi:hypothetical protein
MIKLVTYIILWVLLTNIATGQIIVINPGDRPTNPPIAPPGPRDPITVRPDPSTPGGGDFDGKFYEYCGPSWLGYKCNFLRSGGVAKMRDESNAYKEKGLAAQQTRMDEETAKVDKDLNALREGLGVPNSPAGENIKLKRDAALAHNKNATQFSDSALEVQKTAITQIDTTVDVSFGLAYKESDKKDYEPEARKVNFVIGERFIRSKIKMEQDRADAIENQIRNGVYTNKADRLSMVNSGRAALELSAQSLQQGDVAKSNFALKVGTVFLDTAISVTPVLGWAKDGWEAVTGRNLLTGEKLSGLERTMAVVGVLTAGIGSKLAIAGKAAVLVGVLRAGKATEEAAEVAKVASRAAEIAEAAGKAGLDGAAIKAFKNDPTFITKPLDTIVGTGPDVLKTTQLEVDPLRVDKYISDLVSGKTIPPIEVYNTPSGKVIADGHHRYVASKITGINVPISETPGTLSGFDWKEVTFKNLHLED